MRSALIVCAAALAVVLGGVQFASMALYGDLAQPPAVPALLASAVGGVLAGPLRSPRAPTFLRLAYAQALVHRGDVAAAQAVVMQLPATSRVADLRGQLAESRGDAAAAIEWYARARDFERAQRLIDVSAAARRGVQAEQLEARLVAALGDDADAGVRARAFWRLGQLTQARAAQAPAALPPPVRLALERRALGWYDRALALAPNEETYLLAAGQQALTLGDKTAARGYYLRALDAVPNSADARVGLRRATAP
jgi:tetratricopeptide (TPR) repeat protein